MKHIILIGCLLGCLSKKNNDKENKDIDIKQSLDRTVNSNSFFSKTGIKVAGRRRHRHRHKPVHPKIKRYYALVAKAAEELKKDVHKASQETDVIVEKVEKVSKKVTKVVDRVREALDRFTKFAEATSLAAAIDACFEACDLPITLEELDYTVDGIDESLHVFNMLLQATDLVLRGVVTATNNPKLTAAQKEANQKQKEHILATQNIIRDRANALTSRKNTVKQGKKDLLQPKNELKAIEDELVEMKQTKDSEFHPFRLIYLMQEYLIKLSEVIKKENTKEGMKKLLKPFIKQVEKSKVLYEKILNFLKQKGEGNGGISSNELLIFMFSLFHPHKKLDDIAEKDIQEGMMHNVELISADKFGVVVGNIKNNNFMTDTHKMQKELENVITMELNNPDLFTPTQRELLMAYFKNKKYQKLLKYVDEMIPKHEKKEEKGEQYRLKILESTLGEFMETCDLDMQDIQEDIQKIIEFCEVATKLGLQLKDIVDKCREKLQPHLERQIS